PVDGIRVGGGGGTAPHHERRGVPGATRGRHPARWRRMALLRPAPSSGTDRPQSGRKCCIGWLNVKKFQTGTAMPSYPPPPPTPRPLTPPMILPGRPRYPGISGISAGVRWCVARTPVPGPAPLSTASPSACGAPVRGKECHFMIVRLLQVPESARGHRIDHRPDVTGPFVFPCHILEYEDMRPTGQFTVQ